MKSITQQLLLLIRIEHCSGRTSYTGNYSEEMRNNSESFKWHQFSDDTSPVQDSSDLRRSFAQKYYYPEFQHDEGIDMKQLFVAANVLLIAGTLSAAENTIPHSTLVLSTGTTPSGLSIALPQKDVQVIATVFDIAPGSRLPEEKSSFSRYGYLLAGKLQVTNVRNGRIETYKPGDFIVFDYPIEGAYPWREGASVGDEPVKLLMIDQIEKDQ
jgi:quercetin dioxygenase-like cupin family protein